jgi:HK97 family phage major capsid protein
LNTDTTRRVEALYQSARQKLAGGKTKDAEGDIDKAERLLLESRLPDPNKLDSMPPPPEWAGVGLAVDRRPSAIPGSWERYINRVTAEAQGRDPTANPEYVRAFELAIRSRGEVERSVLGEATAEYYGNIIGSDPDGGYLAPPDVRSQILSRLPAVSEILSLVSVIPTSRSEVQWPRVQPNPDSPDIYTSAFVGSMVPEVGGGGRVAPQFGLFSIQLKKARVESRPSMDLWDDVPGFNQWLIDDGATNLALLMVAQALSGTGVGNNVLGVLNNPDIDASSNVAGTTANQISNTTSDDGSAGKLIDFVYGVPAQYRRQGSFRIAFSSDSEKRIRKLLDGNGRYLWSPEGGFGPRAAGFDGYGVAVDDFIPSGGVAGSRVALAGDFAAIFLALRSAITVQILNERFADEDRIGVVLRTRFGVGIANTRALKIAVV